MSAHDSVIGARIKQTRNANMKRQEVPFKEGDFVYLSTKNITFAKGLARKFIPKYIGPYKIAKDFGNQSFRIELPVHLKKRGVHDVFHSSLLRIHVPNDDRLFPGRMDTQIGESPDIEDEWAVEMIRSHAGTGENSHFEIVWKSGDVTWMPFYQIRHLQALEIYLDLIGVDSASKLPAGKGKPPQDDPQVFLGGMSLNSPPYPPTSPSSPHLQVSVSNATSTAPFTLQFLDINTFFVVLEPPFNFSEYYPLHNIMLDGIQHPNFRRIGRTEYSVTNPNSMYADIIHVGQIAKYLAFDKSLRDGRRLTNTPGIPFGYSHFATIFNDGARYFTRDRRRLSTFISDDAGDHIIKSDIPVTLKDFRITPEQCGIVPPPRFATLTEGQTFVFQEYATRMATESVKKREAIQQRQEKRENPDGASSNKKRKRNQGPRYYEDPSLVVDDDDDNASTTYHSLSNYDNSNRTSPYDPSAHASSSSSVLDVDAHIYSPSSQTGELYTIDPPLPSRTRTQPVTVITEPVTIDPVPEDHTTASVTDQLIDFVTDAIERGDDLVPLDGPGSEAMELTA